MALSEFGIASIEGHSVTNRNCRSLPPPGARQRDLRRQQRQPWTGPQRKLPHTCCKRILQALSPHVCCPRCSEMPAKPGTFPKSGDLVKRDKLCGWRTVFRTRGAVFLGNCRKLAHLSASLHCWREMAAADRSTTIVGVSHTRTSCVDGSSRRQVEHPWLD